MRRHIALFAALALLGAPLISCKKASDTRSKDQRGEQVFVLSGEGKADVVSRFEKQQADWFASARFKALQP